MVKDLLPVHVRMPPPGLGSQSPCKPRPYPSVDPSQFLSCKNAVFSGGSKEDCGHTNVSDLAPEMLGFTNRC
jgi:hypothetical protein